MNVYKLNKPLLELPKSHPAPRLDAFVECRKNCVGKEVSYRDHEDEAVDQCWVSANDGRQWSFSAFAYTYISFDIELDGWLTGSANLTVSERNVLNALPRWHTLLNECSDACKASGNHKVLAMVDQVLELLTLWRQSIEFRVGEA